MPQRTPNQSDGVQTYRFERTDFPQQGWIRKPTGTLYEGNRADPWAYQADRSFRMRDRQDGSAQSNYLLWNRLVRTDFPQQGWLAKPVLQGTVNHLYEALTDFGWFWHTQDYRVYENPSRYKVTYDFWQTVQQQGWMEKPIVNGTVNHLYEAITDYGWYWQTQNIRVYEPLQRYRCNRGFYQTEPQQGWMDFVPGNLYEPSANLSWSTPLINHERMRPNRSFWRPTEPQSDDWIAHTSSIAIGWDNLMDRMGPGEWYKRDTNTPQNDWIGNNSLTLSRFGWTNAPDDRLRQVNYFRHVPQPNLDWINTVTAIPPFDPVVFAAIDQLSKSQRYTSLQRFTMAPDVGEPNAGGAGVRPFDVAIDGQSWWIPDVRMPVRKGLPLEYLSPQRIPFGLLDVRPISGIWAQTVNQERDPKRKQIYFRGYYEPNEFDWLVAAPPVFDPSTFAHDLDARAMERKKRLPWDNLRTEYIYANQLVFPELTLHILDTRLRDRYKSHPWVEHYDQGFIFYQVPAFDPSTLIHTVDIKVPTRYKVTPSLDQVSQGWITANTPAFDPRTLAHWSDDRTRDRYKKRPQLEQPGLDWLFTSVSGFDARLFPHSYSERMGDRLRLRVQRSNWEEMGLAWLRDVLTLPDPSPFTGATTCAGRWGTFNWGDGRWCEDRQLHPYTTDELGRRIYYLSCELVHEGDTDFVIANVTPTLNIKGNLPDKWQAKAGHNDIQYLSIELVHTGNNDFVINTIRPVIALRKKWRGST